MSIRRTLPTPIPVKAASIRDGLPSSLALQVNCQNFYYLFIVFACAFLMDQSKLSKLIDKQLVSISRQAKSAGEDAGEKRRKICDSLLDWLPN